MQSRKLKTIFSLFLTAKRNMSRLKRTFIILKENSHVLSL
jgi:hypothetical protein